MSERALVLTPHNQPGKTLNGVVQLKGWEHNDVPAADEQFGKRIVYPNQACEARGVVEDDIEPVSLRRLQAMAHSFSLLSTLPELARPLTSMA